MRDVMKDIRKYKGAVSRVNMFLSLVLVVVSFASCSGQSKLMNLAPAQPAAAPASGDTQLAGVQGSYADLVSRVSPAVVTIQVDRARASGSAVSFHGRPDVS